jgi:hypothetical protein
MSEINFSDYVYYDETSPSCISWKNNRYAGKSYGQLVRPAGSQAGSFDKKSGYWVVHINKKKYLTHRVIWVLCKGPIPHNLDVDHKDRVKTNNSVNNLRCVSEAINSRNCPMFKNNTSGKTGVCRRNGKYPGWRATWRLLTGERMDKTFYDHMHGELAYTLACEYRDSMIAMLNLQGAGYSCEHGGQLVTEA